MTTILTLEEAREHIGDGVIYKPTGEQGIITSVNDRWVFVRYGANPGGAATSAGMLSLLAAGLEPEHDKSCCMNGIPPGKGPHPDCPGLPVPGNSKKAN